MNSQVINHSSQEKGAATLGLAIVLLLIISLMGLYANKGIWLEQRAAVNQYRGKQAIEAAEAGLEFMIAALNLKTSGTTSAEFSDFLTLDSTTAQYTINSANLPYVVSPGTGLVASITLSAVPGETTPAKRFVVTSSGGSECTDTTNISTCQGRATVQGMARLAGLVANPPSSGLTSLGSASLGGSSCVVNNTGTGLAVTSGGVISFGSGGGGGGGGSCTGSNTSIVNGTPSTVNCGTNTSCNSTTFSAMTGDDFFKYFFGADKATIKSSATTMLTNTAPTDGTIGEFIWITASSELILSGNNTFGSVSSPVIIVVDGDLKITGDNTVWGIIYVIGDSTITGTINSEGAIIVESQVSGSGNSQIVKNQDVLNNISTNFFSVNKVMGSWKDW